MRVSSKKGRDAAKGALAVLALLVPVAAFAQAIPETPGILTTIMNQFLGQFAAGYGHLLPWATRFLFLIAAIELIWAALYWALEGENFLPALIQKTMLIGVFAFLVLNWQTLVNTVANGFISSGAIAGGAGGGAGGAGDGAAWADSAAWQAGARESVCGMRV